MKDKEYHVKFRCPEKNCDGTEVGEVRANYTAIPNIGLSPDGEATADYSESIYDDAGDDVVHFACGRCGYILPPGQSNDAFERENGLFKWLKKHNMLEVV